MIVKLECGNMLLVLPNKHVHPLNDSILLWSMKNSQMSHKIFIFTKVVKFFKAKFQTIVLT